MQIIEQTVFGVRSAILRLEAETHLPSILLFPMIHVAEPGFYEDIARRLDECDVILFEGVESPTTRLLTASYHYFAGNPQFGLVLQNTMKLDHVRDRLVHADVSGRDFEERWSTVRILYRVLLPLVAPIYGYYMRIFGTPAQIAQHLGMDLRKSRQEIFESDEVNEIKEVLVNWRDRRLIRVIERQLTKHANSDITIGVLYGAGHMRAVIRHLIDVSGYRVAKAEWATAITL